METMIKKECVEVESPPPGNDVNVPKTTGSSQSKAQSQENSESDKTRPSTLRQPIHVTVHRHEISAAQVQEGTEELQGLGVDIYDQQIYEKSVFDQVDRAISDPITRTNVEESREARQVHCNPEQQNASTINDLMRLIHDQNKAVTESGDLDATQARDEEVLQLARQQRLNKIAVKTEPTEKESASSLPRIPKLSRKQRDGNNSIHYDSGASTSGTQRQTAPQRTKIEPIEQLPSFLDQDLDTELSSLDDDDSPFSEYQLPTRGESDDDLDDANEDIDYETDSDADKSDLIDSIEPDTEGTKSKKIKDDGDFKDYAARIKAYNRLQAQRRLENIDSEGVEFKKLDEMFEIEGNLRMPKDIWDNLFEHQKTGVRWLWELHQLGTGGILGDEMGLGKTIQMISFLVALRNSNIANAHNGYDNLGPTVLVCPATVMHQWLQEFRKWYPPFRVAILHSTGTFSGDRKQLIRVIHKANGILICSYPGVIIYQDYLHALDWHYAILDEGHKIKNPDSQVTLACKRFRTPHRIVLSGSPVQNNLRELWSIFDFIYPGKLGTLPVFLGQFAIPITQGGYANATDMQVQIAYKCACVLRDTVKPFLLRRTKAEVNSKLKLPERSEQVLFCKLTDKQRKLYQHFLDSPTVRDIKRGMLQIFVGLIQMRKICNHPDIFDASECNRQVKQSQKHQERKAKHLEFFSVDETYGHYQKSGKMMVVDALLKLWKKQGNKVLLFTQSRQMLKIFAQYLNEREYKHLTMDGSTPIGIRHSLIDEFNNSEDLFIFLLTTRVGGVGVNLIGANRIIIYDPDWNPSTDIQARERAWRIGQQRHVIIYRLLTAGTIEEKIYHRQVFKLYLTNRILKDAKQKRFFKTNDLHELFTLGHDDNNIETKALFDDDLQIDERSIKRSKKKDKKRKRKSSTNDGNPRISEEKLREMRERAKRLSQMIALNYGSEQINDQNESLADKTSPSLPAAINNISRPTNNDTLQIAPLQLIGDDIPDTMGVHERTPPDEPIGSMTTINPVFHRAAISKSKISDSSSERKKKGQQVEYLVKQDVYRPKAPDQSEARESRYKRDDYILERLFKNSNIFGALKHDRIESDTTADFKVVESEAEKVARDAIRALRESRRLCLGSTSGIPNWTGRNGHVATTIGARLMPKNKARAQQFTRSCAALSLGNEGSDSILSSIKKRNQSNPVSLRNSQNGPSLDSDEEEATNKDFEGRAKEVGAGDVADKIRDFVLFKSATRGEAQTEEVLEFFKSTFEPDKTPVFKAILYKLCEFQRRGDKGFWRLRSEFRSM